MTRSANLFAASPALPPAFLRAHRRCDTPAQGKRWFLREHAVRGDGIVSLRFCRGLLPLAPVDEREGCNVVLLEDGCRDRRLSGLHLPLRRLFLPRLESYDVCASRLARTSRFSVICSALKDAFRRQIDVGDGPA
jgi:hypothetical protein